LWLWFLLLTVNVAFGELACKDMDGKDVDWFVALKIPNLAGKKYEALSKFIKFGQAFYYADSNNPEFRLSPLSINDSKSAIGMTVSQAIGAYKSKAKDQMYMFYNDQPPTGKDFTTRAHAKGLMNFNDKQGFWLIHSAPRFNDPTSGTYSYPGTAMKFGQSFLCGTYLSDQLLEISRQVFVSHFGVYQKNLPASMATKYPRLDDILNKDASVEGKCEYTRNSAIKTKGGKWFSSYEKNKQAQSDLYVNQVAIDKKKSFYVETWLNGPRDWMNLCGSTFVKNIRSIRHPVDGVEWSSANDHSKWAVSDKAATVCIGDINRQRSQSTRGGGTLCMENPKIWEFFRASVGKSECCPGDKQCEPMPNDSIAVPPRSRKPGDPAVLKS